MKRTELGKLRDKSVDDLAAMIGELREGMLKSRIAKLDGGQAGGRALSPEPAPDRAHQHHPHPEGRRREEDMNQDPSKSAEADDERGNRKRVIGVVASAKMQKTRVVAVTELFRHAKYGKYVKRTQNFHVHDVKNDSKEGDKVLIVETRPLSKTKRWRLMQVLERAV